jgi:TolB-like protein/DNA-binding winged helix-turn-helix (wHTH) protein/Tfp pilus assembly protein PilF
MSREEGCGLLPNAGTFAETPGFVKGFLPDFRLNPQTIAIAGLATHSEDSRDTNAGHALGQLGPMRTSTRGRIARFGIFEADLDRRRLTKSGFRIRLQEQPFQILALLVERQGQVVTREELKERVWSGDTFVAFDDGLNTAIKKLRAALCDFADNPRFVETVPRVGYRFVAPVSIESPPAPVDPAASASSSEPAPIFPGTAPATSSAEPVRPDLGHMASRAKPTRWAWIGVGAVALLLGGLLLRGWTRHVAATAQSKPIHAIAVLPLQNTSADPNQEYLADGITDEIITDLAKLAGPKVISRTSAMQYKGTRKKIPDIARELRVGAIVEGSVERSADRMRVRVQLIDAATDQHLWAESYDRQMSDVLQLEADVARDIAQQIQFHVSPQQQQTLSQIRPTNPQAFQDYLQGRQYWATRSEQGLHKAIEFFNRAIEEDPGDARSYAGLAHCYIVFPLLYNVPHLDAYAKARVAAKRALELDPSLAEAHLANAEILLNQDWDFAGAEQEFQRTLALNPNYATGHQWYGEYLSVRGRREEAIREMQTTLALDPLSPVVHHQAGQTYQQARQYDRALAEYQQALALNPNFNTSYESMSWAYRRKGKYDEAIEALRRAVPSWEPDFPGITAALVQLDEAYKKGGKAGFLRGAMEFHRHYARPAYYLARDYVDLGQKDKAYTWLARTYQERDPELFFIFTDPEFAGMRSEPRFQELVRKIEKK